MGKIICKDKLKFLFSVLLLIFSIAVVDCYAAPRDIELLNTGYGYYLSYQPKKAAEEFRTFLKEFPQSSAKDAALYWLGKSLVQLNEFQEARKVFTDLKQTFPESPFSSFTDKELEIIGKAEYPPMKDVPSQMQSVKNKTDEKVESRGAGQENVIRNPEKQKINLEEEKKNEKLTAQLKEPEKEKEKTEEPQAKVKEVEKEKREAGELQTTIKTLEKENAEESQAEGEELEEADEETDALQTEVNELKKTEKKSDVLEEKIKELEDEKKQTEALQAKIKELEEEKKRAKELESKAGELEAAKKRADELQAKLKALEEGKKTQELLIKQTSVEEEKKKSEELQFKIKELVDEKKKAEGLQAKIRELEGKESYLLNSSAVLNKLGMKDVLWRSGNIPEDLVNETMLYQEAKKLNISEDMMRHKELTKKFGFNRGQEDYLERYLTICSFIDLKLKDMPAEDVFEQLIVAYDEDTRYTKIVLASELQKQAKSGMSFEEVYNLYPDLITFKITGFDELPEWIQEKVSSMQTGELGVVWSDEGYRILKRSVKKLSLKSCEEVHPETRDKIKAYIADHLKEIKGATKSNEEESDE